MGMKRWVCVARWKALQTMAMSRGEWKKLLEGAGLWEEYLSRRKELSLGGMDKGKAASVARLEYEARLGFPGGDEVDGEEGMGVEVDVGGSGDGGADGVGEGDGEGLFGVPLLAKGMEVPDELMEELKGKPFRSKGDDEWAYANYALLQLGKKGLPLHKLVDLRGAPSLGAVSLLLLARANPKDFLNGMLRKSVAVDAGGLSMADLTDGDVERLQGELGKISRFLGGAKFGPGGASSERVNGCVNGNGVERVPE